MFMVKKLVDEEKGEMPGICEKECKGLFINVSRFEMDEFRTPDAGFVVFGAVKPKSEVLQPKVQKSLQFKFQVFQ